MATIGCEANVARMERSDFSTRHSGMRLLAQARNPYCENIISGGGFRARAKARAPE